MSTVSISSVVGDVLRERVAGTVLVPGQNGYEEATLAFNTSFVQRPAFVVVPEDEADVVAVVEIARAHGLQVAPQRTGHNAEPLEDLSDLILLRTDRLRGVEIDVATNVARVRAGSKWADVVPSASALGLAAPHGSTTDVSVTGYALGGGVGWYGRKHGLATNNVVAIEIVTADGELRRVDHDTDPDLFWALRGGGGSFGVVTAVEIQLFPMPDLYAGILFFGWERSAEVLHAWLDWTREVPEEVGSQAAIFQFPDIPDVPEPVRGGRFVVVQAAIQGDRAFGEALIEPLRALGPGMDTFAMVAPADIAELALDPPDPVPYTAAGEMYDALDHDAIDAFVAAAGPASGSPLLVATIRHYGGAMRRSSERHGVLDTFDCDYLTLHAGMVLDEESRALAESRIEEIERALAPYRVGRRYLNFAEKPGADVSSFYTPEAYQALREVKAQYDPRSLFRANHPIEPATGA